MVNMFLNVFFAFADCFSHAEEATEYSKNTFFT